MDEEYLDEEEMSMSSGYAIKPKTPFVTKKALKRVTLTSEGRAKREFIRSHNFHLEKDSVSGKYKCVATKK